MSVYNRKMFKPRNARNALNMSAGIMPVQKFHAGGPVGHIHAGQTRNIRPASGGSVFAPRSQSMFTSPITGQSYRGTTPSGTGIASLQPLDIARRYISGGRTVGYGEDDAISPGEYAALQASQSSYLAGQAVQDPTDTRLGGAIAAFTRPVAQTAAGGGAFIRGLATQGLQSLLSSPDGAGTDTMGQRVAGMKPGALDQDYLTSLGLNEIDPTAYSSPIGPQPAAPSRGMFQGPPTAPYQVDMSNPEDRARIEQERIARVEMDRIGSVVGNEEAELSPTGFLPTTTPSLESATDNALTTSDSSPEPEDQMFMGLGDAPPPEGDGTSTTKGGAGTDGAGTDGSDGAPTGKEEIDRVINSGTKEEQQSTLDGFIKEFMDKAPGYEGADSGLILAKIGFAMAAGKSPRAIENIASAMSDGADMLIKDKAKKDEFNRQLKLSAMQYGFTETGKLRAEDRLEAREGRGLNYFVAEADVTINGKKYKKGNTVPVSTAYIRENGLPGELQTTELAKAAITANSSYQKALLKAQEKGIIDPKTYTGLVEKLNVASTDFQSANSMRSLVEGNIIKNAEGNITGLGPAFNDLLNKAYNTVGVKSPKEYENVAKYNQDMRRVSNLLLKDLLGEGSKNVSNIDRKLADEIVGLYSGVGGYVAADPDLLNERLQNILVTLDQKERNALSVFRGASESTEGFTFRSGKAVDFNIPAEARALLGEQNVQGLVKYGVGDDGVYRRLS